LDPTAEIQITVTPTNARRRHSHSIIFSHDSAMIFQRNFPLHTAKDRAPISQKYVLLNSKVKLADLKSAWFQRLSASIGRSPTALATRHHRSLAKTADILAPNQ
jgi:hypothetical protein